MTFLLPDGIPEKDDWPEKCVWRHKERELNFSWVDTNVAGCQCPKLDKDLLYLREQGISALAGIWEKGIPNGPDKRKLRRGGIGLFLREPIPDWGTPTHNQLATIYGFIDAAIRGGDKIAVACGWGEGRTGTVLTCYLVRQGMTPFSALRTMLQKQRIPYENCEQRDCILSYHA